MHRIWLTGALVAVTASTLYAEGKSMRPGRWRIKVTHEMKGMPYTPPPTEFERCFTPEEASDPKKAIRKQSEDCDPADFKVEGNHVRYHLICHHRGGTQTGDGEVTYEGDHYAGTMTLQLDDPRMGHMTMVEHIAAQRAGDCKP